MMTQTKFQQVLLYILQKAGKPLHLAILLRTIADCKNCSSVFLMQFVMDDGKKSMYILIIKGFDPNSEMNNRYPSFYQPFTYDEISMTVSSSKSPELKDFTNDEIKCLDQSITKNKDLVYVPHQGSGSGKCDCFDW